MDGSESGGKEGFKDASPDSGPEGYIPVPVWRLEARQSHNSTMLNQAVTGCVTSPKYPDLPCPSETVYPTTKGTLILDLHFMSVEPTGQMCRLKGLASSFPHLKALKHLLYTHPTSVTHASFFSLFLEIVCDTQVFCWKG